MVFSPVLVPVFLHQEVALPCLEVINSVFAVEALVQLNILYHHRLHGEEAHLEVETLRHSVQELKGCLVADEFELEYRSFVGVAIL